MLALADGPGEVRKLSELGGIGSTYSERLNQLLISWPQDGTHGALSSKFSSDGALRVECISTPEAETYLGFAQFQTIKAPVERIEKVLSDYASYTELFNDLEKVEIKKQEGAKTVVFTEQNIPIPFVANERNEMIYETLNWGSGKKAIRYQLLKSNHLKKNDGLIILETASPDLTRYYEYDFWDASYGIAKAFGTERIWRDALEGLVQADLAVKYKAEHPELPNKEIKKRSTKEAETFDTKTPVSKRQSQW